MQNGSITLKSNFSINSSTNITRVVTAYWNNSNVEWSEASSNSTLMAMYNITGISASTAYYYYNNSLLFNNGSSNADGDLGLFSYSIGRNATLLVTSDFAGVPFVTINYPDSAIYLYNVNTLSYTLIDDNPEYCWYTNITGGNSSPVLAGVNFTVATVEGSNTRCGGEW